MMLTLLVMPIISEKPAAAKGYAEMFVFNIGAASLRVKVAGNIQKFEPLLRAQWL